MKPGDQGAWRVQEQAVEWVHRLRGSEANQHRTAFRRWYAMSAQHRCEFRLMSIVEGQFDALRCLPQEDIDKLNSRNTRKRRAAPPGFAPLSRRLRVWGTATACCLVLTLGLLWTSVLIAASTTYTTRTGEYRRVTLEDGTTIELNTDSRVVVRFTREQRTAELVEGEAIFDVASDERRFVVYAGMLPIEDIGTRFGVRRQRSNITDIVVAEGRVRAGGIELMAGEASTLTSDHGTASIALRKLTPQELDRAFSWTEGYLSLSGETLAAILGELNRYHHRPMVIADPSIATLRLGGRVSTRNLQDFATALEMFGIQLIYNSDGPILLARKSAEALER